MHEEQLVWHHRWGVLRPCAVRVLLRAPRLAGLPSAPNLSPGDLGAIGPEDPEDEDDCVVQ